MGALTAIAVGAAVVGGAAAANEGNKARRAAQTAATDRMNQYNGIPIPDIEDQELDLLIPQLVGEVDPEMMQAMNLDPSAMEQVTANAELKNDQQQTLASLRQIAEGGLSEADKAASRDIQREVSQSDRARQKAILQNMDQRGVLGSGMELAARLSSAQQAADQQSRAGDQLAQQAQARALQALTQSGSMAGQMRSQDFGEQSQVAQARDAINKFNTVNRQDIANSNVGTRNQAQATNLAARQAQADNAAALQNQQQQYNKELLQQQFNNRTGIADRRAGIIADRGAQEQQAHRDTAAGIGQAAGGISNIFGSFGGK